MTNDQTRSPNEIPIPNIWPPHEGPALIHCSFGLGHPTFPLMIRLLLFLSIPLYILDQVTKNWIVRHFVRDVDMQEVVPGFFYLHHVANTGIAFGQFNGSK